MTWVCISKEDEFLHQGSIRQTNESHACIDDHDHFMLRRSAFHASLAGWVTILGIDISIPESC